MMTFHEMTYKQGQALAAFLRELRGDWDKPGIEHALGIARSKGTAPDVAVAAIKAAALASNRTPAVIGMDGPHWREPATEKPNPTNPRPPKRAEECPHHAGQWADSCSGCAADQLAGETHPPLAPELRKPDVSNHLTRARAELASAKASRDARETTETEETPNA